MEENYFEGSKDFERFHLENVSFVDELNWKT